MTEANTCSIQNSTNGCGDRLGEESKTTAFLLFCLFGEVSAGGRGGRRSTGNIFYFNRTCVCKRGCSSFKARCRALYSSKLLFAFLHTCAQETSARRTRKKGASIFLLFFFFFWDIKRETDTHFFTRQNSKPRQTVRTGAELKKTYRVCVCSLQMRKELD